MQESRKQISIRKNTNSEIKSNLHEITDQLKSMEKHICPLLNSNHHHIKINNYLQIPSKCYYSSTNSNTHSLNSKHTNNKSNKLKINIILAMYQPPLKSTKQTYTFKLNLTQSNNNIKNYIVK